MSDLLDERAFLARAPWGRDHRVVTIEDAREHGARGELFAAELARMDERQRIVDRIRAEPWWPADGKKAVKRVLLFLSDPSGDDDAV